MGDKKITYLVQCLPPDRYDSYLVVFLVDNFTKISQTIAKRNDLVCNDLVVGTVFKVLILNGNNKKKLVRKKYF